MRLCCNFRIYIEICVKITCIKGKVSQKDFILYFGFLDRPFLWFLLDLLHTLKGCTPSQHPHPPPPHFFFTCFSNRHPPQYILTGTRLPLSKTMSRACIYVQAPQQAIDISLIGLSFNIHELPPSYQIYFDWRKSLFD